MTRRHSLLFVAIVLGTTLALSAQQKPPLGRADYAQWETIAPAGARGGLSPDGRWLAYSLSRVSRANELRFVRLSDGMTKTVPFGTQATFSADSRWAACSVGYSQAEQDRLRQERRPIQNKLALIDLTGGEMTTIDGIQSFNFSASGRAIAMRRYAATTAAAGPTGTPAATGATGPTGAAETQPPGVTVLVRDLTSGLDTTFGNVAEMAWQGPTTGDLLAMAVSAEGQAGNGVHLYDAKSFVLRVLDSGAAAFSGLTWRDDSADLVVLRSKTDERREGPTHVALAWRGLGTPSESRATFDPASAPSFPAGMRTVSFRRPSWSDSGKVVFLGIAKWDDKPPAPARGAGRGAAAPAGGNAGGGRGGTATPAAGTPASTTPEPDEPAGVDIWHWKDVEVIPRQKLSATADRRRNLISAWHLDSGRLVQLGQSWRESVQLLPNDAGAYVEEWSATAMERTIGRPTADLYLADLDTGARTKLRDRVDDRYAQLSPGGRYVLFLQDDHYWTIDLKSKAVTSITRNVRTSFVDRESDQTVSQKPPFGVAGWTKDDAGVILNDKHDLWLVAPDGSRATRLTNGGPEQIRHRYTRLDPDTDVIDLGKPTYVSLFGLLSKKSGYATLEPGAGGATPPVTRRVWLDKGVAGLAKARNADVYVFTQQGHDDSPDVFASGPALDSARQVTSSNPFQANYAWSRSEIVEYRTDKGARLQGALYYPAGYEPGKRYPMIVYLYERLSDNVHRYVAPSDRDYYNTTVFTSQGYFVLQPDIVFRPREPGVSVVECVTPAVKQVVQMGVVDPARVGVVGHSWGGFDASYLATHTTMFAASVAGAAITNLVSNYGNHHWSSGIAETDHIETGQQRMEVPIYADLPAYIRNSAVFNVQNMTTPLMLMTGDNDGTVYWHQAVELYNIARRAGKNVVMLVYNGEDHGLQQRKNQVDYQRRILEWFGHYLKGDAAPGWIAEGQSFLDRDAEVKRQAIRRTP